MRKIHQPPQAEQDQKLYQHVENWKKGGDTGSRASAIDGDIHERFEKLLDSVRDPSVMALMQAIDGDLAARDAADGGEEQFREVVDDTDDVVTNLRILSRNSNMSLGDVYAFVDALRAGE